MRIDEFDPEIYPVKLWVVTNEDKSICDMFRYKYNDKPIEIDDITDWIARTTSMVVKNDTGKYGIIISLNHLREISASTMAHEACHFVDGVYNYIEAKEIDLGGEQHAYFLQWAVECIDNVVKTTKGKNKMAKKTTTTKKKPMGGGKKC